MAFNSVASAYDHGSQAGGSQSDKDNEGKKKFCTRRLVIRLAIVLVVIVGAVLALVFALAPPGGPKEWFLHTPPPGLQEAQRWNNGGYGGLKLTVLNAVDDSYQTLFYEWIQRWDNGTPDALTLTTEKVSYESDCAPEDDVLKVCNGNYGNTGWRGIDLNTMYEGYILNSVAKMNDYYLTGEGETWKEYTMCHELGHGWGLPHTEENYYDSNSGTCLDLTLNPDGDIQPGQYNFNLLVELYGSVDGKMNATRITNSTTSGTSSYGGSSRHLRDINQHQQVTGASRAAMPSSSSRRALLQERYLTAAKLFEQGNPCSSQSGSKNKCTIDLGDGFSLNARLFLVEA